MNDTPTPRTKQNTRRGCGFFVDPLYAARIEAQLNLCASMLGIVDVDLNNTDIPVEQIGAWMQGRIVELQEGNANYAELRARFDKLKAAQ